MVNLPVASNFLSNCKEVLLEAQMEAFQAAVRGASLDLALDILIRAAAGLWESGVRCGFYIVSRDGRELHHVSGMSESYAQCVDGFKVGRDSLACGLAVHTGCPVITPDVTREPLWEPWLWLSQDYNFRGCWSFPIESEERRVVGTLALYFPAAREATPLDIEAAAILTHAAAIIISRHQERAERGRAEGALHDSELRFREFGEASSDVLWVRSADSMAIEYLSPAFEVVYDLNRSSLLGTDGVQGWEDLVHPQDRADVVAILERVRRGERVTHDFRIVRRSDQRIRWIRESTFPLFDEAGRLCRIGGIGRDITDQKTADAQNELLIKEVSHRSKNLLSVVQAIVHQTARNADAHMFANEISARLGGLIASQDLLLKGYRGVEIGDLVRSQLAHLAGLIGDRITIAGPAIRLTTSASQKIGMAVHELATNASKYGALSNGLGTISVNWSLSTDGAGSSLRMTWEEKGGPPVSVPAHRGFGTQVLVDIMQLNLGAEVDLEYAQQGLCWRLIAPAESVIQQDS